MSGDLTSSLQRGSLRPDVPADIWPKTSVRPSNCWKNKQFGTDMPRRPRGRPRKNFGLKNFGLIFVPPKNVIANSLGDITIRHTTIACIFCATIMILCLQKRVTPHTKLHRRYSQVFCSTGICSPCALLLASWNYALWGITRPTCFGELLLVKIM